MEEYVVTAEEFQEQAVQLLQERQQTSALIESIGAERFSQLAAGDAAEIMTKITGVAVVEGKFAVVRGLSDRYNLTVLNGGEIPTADPYRKSAQLDMFPSEVLETVVVSKTFTPDLPGGFSGALVDLRTKAFPEKFLLANTSALEGVPSMDRHGNLFFVSTRSYAETLLTIYRGRFGQGKVSGIELVAGISLRQRGMVTFDAEVSADGSTLFVADGRFAGGHVPETADIDIAVRDGAGFRRLPGARDLLRNVNTAALEYAPAVSGDLLELFFTRLEGSARSPRTAILRAVRPDAGAPFGAPQRLASITGFVEAPALSGDGRSLYYHRLDGGRFVILRVARSIRP